MSGVYDGTDELVGLGVSAIKYDTFNIFRVSISLLNMIAIAITCLNFIKHLTGIIITNTNGLICLKM